MIQANLFVPKDYPGYDKMLELHEQQKGEEKISYFENRKCYDKVVRFGLWVPLEWWETKEITNDLTGAQKPEDTEKRKADALENAKIVGAEISSGAVQLSDEAKALLWKEPTG